MHYDFIEIGTSDFDTLIQTANEDAIGLSIEPIGYYLDRLPNKNNVKKVNAAISNVDSSIDIYYIKEEDIERHNLPFWIRGCNSIGQPHKYARGKIGSELYDSIVSIDKVKLLSWNTLVDEYDITSVDYIKIDTEGHDLVILEAYIDLCSNKPYLLANTIQFEYNELSHAQDLERILCKINGYEVIKTEDDIILKKEHKKAFVVYANEAYADIAELCVESIKKHSKYPVYVYMLDSKKKIEGAINFTWKSKSIGINDRKEYIDRENPEIYKLLIERPAVMRDALQYSDMVCYVDCDSIATKYVDTIFDYFDENSSYPYFVEGIYEFLHYNNRGGAETFDDLTNTLEHPVCELFHSNQLERKYTKYRQTGYFVAGKKCIDFLELWYYRCNHPAILKNNAWYAPYNEETILQTLLYDYKAYNGLPYIYINGYRKPVFTGEAYELETWVRIPAKENQLLFYHGEKNIEKIKQIIYEDSVSS